MTLILTFNARYKLQNLIDFGGQYIYRDSREKNEYNRICSTHMDKTMKEFIVKIVIICTSFAAAAIGPLNALFVHGIYTTAIEARIPFTEPKSNVEFAGNFSLQMILSIHGFIAYIGLECLLSILENAVTITPRLVESDIMHTIQQYERKSITELELRMKISKIAKQSVDADK